MKIAQDHTDILTMLLEHLEKKVEYWNELASVSDRREYCEGAKQAIFEVKWFLTTTMMQYMMSKYKVEDESE